MKITPQERKTAIAAAKAMGLSVAGVDLLRSERGPLVMEVNSSPGLEGIEAATGKDVAGMIIEFIEKKAAGKKNTVKKLNTIEELTHGKNSQESIVSAA
ncbi:protein of unknown function [Vibrio tapetis subsp. tapetis]|uniref:ATP-grasp domain-containing protein n=1 Tax=Vibrio tapetis subsp. tapetis TaxID=1671868 RepID=A0A2N8Z8W0_9VIBR|nr:protein of unknown function [Vibrio tapetis subsp. tapetis]